MIPSKIYINIDYLITILNILQVQTTLNTNTATAGTTVSGLITQLTSTTNAAVATLNTCLASVGSTLAATDAGTKNTLKACLGAQVVEIE